MKNILEKREYTSRDLLTLTFHATPFYAWSFVIMKFIRALMPTITIFATAAFIDAAIAVGRGEKPLSAVIWPISGLALAMLYSTLFTNVIMSYFTAGRKIYMRRTLRSLILAHVAVLDYRYIENQDSVDLINRVVPSFDQEVYSGFASITILSEKLISAAGVVITVMSQAWWAGLIILASAVPLMFIAKKGGQQSYQAQREVTKIHRRVNYLSNEVLNSRDAVEERTVYGYTDDVNATYLERFHTARKIQLRVDFKFFLEAKAGGVLGTVIAVGTILSIMPGVLSGGMEYGMFVALIGGIFNLVSALSWGINSEIQDITKRREYLRDLTKLMSFDTVDSADAVPAPAIRFEQIVFKNVSFVYPGTEKRILDNVSFEIKSGCHYAFVGVNGAGKTTITKLLTGLYTNYTGEILVDGHSLRDFSQAELKGLSAVVYQDFARYSFSLYDNIAIGAVDCAADTAVNGAVGLIGLEETVNKLPEGLQTNLGKIYENAVDISGGEWQRVAMARSLVNSAPLQILDEPTAALDPVSESRVYSQFEQISQGKTTIFISHRLGSTKLADVIYVLADGAITERGTHSELVQLDGLYAEMYTAQAGWYTAAERPGRSAVPEDERMEALYV